MKFIKNSLGSDRSFLTVEQFNSKYELQDNFLTFYCVSSAIPTEINKKYKNVRLENCQILNVAYYESRFGKAMKQGKVQKYVDQVLIQSVSENQKLIMKNGNNI